MSEPASGSVTAVKLAQLILCLYGSDDTHVSESRLTASDRVSELASGSVNAVKLAQLVEQITGVEPASSVWETEVIAAILYLLLLPPHYNIFS